MCTYSCRQHGIDLDWTEVSWDYNQNEKVLAENFCQDFILDGDPPYLVDVCCHYQDNQITSWKVDKVEMPVYQATPLVATPDNMAQDDG